jgi:hypothetical protein
MLTPTQKGNIAEAKLAAAAIELDIGVSRPLCEGQRYDLIFDLRPTLLRVQCKWAPRKGDVIVVRIRTSRFTPNGYIRTTYDSTEVDAIGVYCPDLDASFLLPIADFDGQGYAHLRLSPARNRQRGAIRMASAYRLGAIAQLGERVSGRHEVAGSSPASSISDSSAVVIGAHEFRERFGYWMDRAAAGSELVVARHGKPIVRVTAAC